MSGERSVEASMSLDLFPPVLDACCGSRMFWFDRADPRALFIDKRQGTWPIDIGTPGTVGRSPIVVAPDVLADFSAMPFADESFRLVVFDPPHIQRQEARGALTRRYGVLNGDWREMLRKGFSECLRVLKPNGVLVFKWGESQFKVADIVALAPVKPLFGHHTSKTTHWAVFMKDPQADEDQLK
jgi:SAM-dependent methyltransferase